MVDASWYSHCGFVMSEGGTLYGVTEADPRNDVSRCRDPSHQPGERPRHSCFYILERDLSNLLLGVCVGPPIWWSCLTENNPEASRHSYRIQSQLKLGFRVNGCPWNFQTASTDVMLSYTGQPAKIEQSRSGSIRLDYSVKVMKDPQCCQSTRMRSR
ncbi:hypothetical protein BDV11DRAFT_55888 [Aspergillus similis]